LVTVKQQQVEPQPPAELFRRHFEEERQKVVANDFAAKQ